MAEHDVIARDFLARFVSASETGDTDALGSCFADVFMYGDAKGTQPVPRAAFLAALPRRRQQFADAGVSDATALASQAVTSLDEHYVLLQTEWTAPRVDGGPPVELSSSFLLHVAAETATAVAYLNHRGL